MLARAQIIGRIGKKEQKTLKNGNNLVVLSLATKVKYLDSMGAQQEVTSWHNIDCYRKMGEIVEKYAHVGDLIFVEGDISNKKITTGNGVDKWVYSITATQVKLLPNNKEKSFVPKEEEHNVALPATEEFGDIPF